MLAVLPTLMNMSGYIVTTFIGVLLTSLFWFLVLGTSVGEVWFKWWLPTLLGTGDLAGFLYTYLSMIISFVEREST